MLLDDGRKMFNCMHFPLGWVSKEEQLEKVWGHVMRWIDSPWTTIEPCAKITDMFGYLGAVKVPEAYEHLLNVWNLVQESNDEELQRSVLSRDNVRESTEPPWRDNESTERPWKHSRRRSDKVVNFTYLNTAREPQKKTFDNHHTYRDGCDRNRNQIKIESTFEIEIVIKIEIEFEFEFESGIEIDVETHGRSVAERRLTRMTMVARAAPWTASGTRLTRMSMVAAPRTASGTSPSSLHGHASNGMLTRGFVSSPNKASTRTL